MILTTPTRTIVERGDVWEVRFDPSEGDEIRKIRPAVVVSMKRAGRMNLQIVVPITAWQPHFLGYFWLVQLLPTQANGLRKVSAADTFQIKSVSVNRFQRKLGAVTDADVNRIAKAIALCIGYDPTP